MKKWCFLLAALLLLPLSACGGSEDESCLRGRVAEVQRGADGLPSALILDIGDGEQEGVLWDEATQWALPPAAAELSPAEVWEDPLGMEVTVYLSPEAGPGSLTARNGTEFSDAGTADFLTVDEIRLPEFLTLSDGTEAEIWVDFWGDRSYRLSGGTELLRERPQDMDFPTYYVEGDTPLTALPSALLEGVAAYYQERGDIYDIQEEVERAYQAFRQSEDPEQFSNFLVEQRVGWAATAPGVYYFRTTVILPVREQEITELLQGLLYEFPLRELDLFLPAWVEALPPDHPIKTGVYQAVRREAADLAHVRQLRDCLSALQGEGDISAASIRSLNLGIGIAEADLDLPRSLFYDTLSRQSGLSVTDDGDLMQLLTSLAAIRKEYDRLAPAMQAALDTGYGIVMPSVEELNLEDPEIVRQGGRYSVRMKASAPSVHMIRADIATTVSPIVGNEKQSEDMVNYLLQEFEGDTGKLWQSNIFGRSFHEIVGDDLQAKLRRMPLDSQKKLREALERIINDGSGGLICIIL